MERYSEEGLLLNIRANSRPSGSPPGPKVLRKWLSLRWHTCALPNITTIASLSGAWFPVQFLVEARRQLNGLPDEIWTKVSIEFYADTANAVFKSLME